jgi:hypothetical protein
MTCCISPADGYGKIRRGLFRKSSISLLLDYVRHQLDQERMGARFPADPIASPPYPLPSLLSLAATRYLLEMYRRQLSDQKTRKLQRLDSPQWAAPLRADGDIQLKSNRNRPPTIQLLEVY